MRRHSTKLLALSLALLGSGAAKAASVPGDEIGTTLQVINVVTAELSTERRSLAIGDGVREDEIIEAAADARTELKLEDETKLALGPGARLKLDRFVYDPAKKKGNIAVDLLTGTFRFMTGVAKKPSYVVRVPRASITVRGTIFDVFVQPSGAAWVLLHEGGIKVCNDRGTCRIHSQIGKLILVNEEGDVGKPFRWTSLDGVQGFSFDEGFPFVASPPSIDPNPIFTRAALIEEATPLPLKPKTRSQKDAASDEATERPAKKPRRGSVPEDPAQAIPSKPPKVVVTLPKPKKPKRIAELPEMKPPRVAIAKPKKRRPPKLETAEVEEKGRQWKAIAEAATTRLIERAQSRRGNRDIDHGQKLQSSRPAFGKSPMKTPSSLRSLLR